ncbi:MAG: hypothetical protein VB878_20835 [Pirellulaceae bacterium]
MVTLEAAESDTLPTKFAFGEAKLPVNEIVFQRYNDVDLVLVDRIVDLEETYREASIPWIPIALAAGFGLMLFVGVGIFVLTRPSPVTRPSVHCTGMDN